MLFVSKPCAGLGRIGKAPRSRSESTCYGNPGSITHSELDWLKKAAPVGDLQSQREGNALRDSSYHI